VDDRIEPILDRAKVLLEKVPTFAPGALGVAGGGVAGGVAGAGAGAVIGAVLGPGGAAIGFVAGFTVGTMGGATGGYKLARWLQIRGQDEQDESKTAASE